jgi:tetratricopeptide (TPR) repeat protein
VTEYQSDLAATRNLIASLFSEVGKPVEALAAYQQAVTILGRLARENPTFIEYQRGLAASHNNIGNLLSRTGEPEEALAAYKEALAIRERIARENPTVTEYQSGLAASHLGVGYVLRETGKPEEALVAYRQALAIWERLAREHPQAPDFASDLASVLNNLAILDLDAERYPEARDRLREAITCQKRALAANPDHPTYRQSLMQYFTNLRMAAEVSRDAALVAEARQELAQLRATDPQFVNLTHRLDAVVAGAAVPDNTERLVLAQHAYDSDRFAVAAMLWNDAFESDPQLTQSRDAKHAYNAACAAALAGCGHGNDDPPLDDAARQTLRRKARTWLTTELALWSKLLETGDFTQREAIARRLSHWQKDTDLAGVREPEPLEKLPEDERQAWQALWTEVAMLLSQAQAPQAGG